MAKVDFRKKKNKELSNLHYLLALSIITNVERKNLSSAKTKYTHTHTHGLIRTYTRTAYIVKLDKNPPLIFQIEYITILYSLQQRCNKKIQKKLDNRMDQHSIGTELR